MTRPRALFFLLASAILLGVMAFLSKLACHTYDGATVAGLRFGLGALATGALWATGRVDARPKNPRLLLLRGLLGGSAVVLYFLAIEHLNVGLATLLNYTSPPFTVCLAWFFLREKVPVKGLLSLAVTMAGVALVVLGQPGDVAAVADQRAPPAWRPMGDGFWIAMGLLSAVCSAGAITVIRALRTGPAPESVWSIFLAFCTVGVLCSAPLSQGVHAPDGTEALILLGVGATAMAGQLGMNRVMRWVPAALFGITAQLSVVVTMLLGGLLLGESWSAVSMVGAGVTMAGVAWAARVSQGGPANGVSPGGPA